MSDPNLNDPNAPTSSGNIFDSIEIQPSRKNFGTLTNQSRPTVKNLSMGNIQKHFESGGDDDIDVINEEDKELEENEKEMASTKKNKKKKKQKPKKKFGMFDGVLARCLLCIWGVIMYLRTGWIVGNSGIWQSTIVMVLASSVTFLTSLSLSAICTNGDVKSGGYYFLISRSLGPEFGGVIGILFAFANCISVAMYLTGFSETIVSLYSDPLTGSETWDTVIWAEVTLFLLLLMAFRGVGGIIKFDMVLLVILIISIIAFWVGTFGVTDPDPEGIGYTGYSSKTFSQNWNSDYQEGEDFVSVFSVFFPAVTGEMAGANISGDLKNPSYAIPNGTLSAIVISTIVYIGIAWTLGATVLRRVGDSTTKGLLFDFLIMAKIAAWEPLVIVGIFASTLSSGMSCFVGAPRIFMAVCQDNVFPQLSYFAKPRESDGEPVRSYFVAYGICFLAILTGNINFIAPIITNFFLITYALMNYSCFAWSMTRSPGWRPTFRWYNKWVSLFTSAECIVLMFMVDWLMALITVIISFLLYYYVAYTEPSMRWGTASEALTYQNTVKKLLKYQMMNMKNAKNQRPTFLIFNRSTDHVKYMYEFAQIMNEKCRGLTMIGDIIIGDHKDHAITNKYIQRGREHQWDDIPEEIIKNSLIQTCIAPSFVNGVRTILQTSGLGAIKPNVALFNIKDYKLNTDQSQPVITMLKGTPTPSNPASVNDAKNNLKEVEKSDGVDIIYDDKKIDEQLQPQNNDDPEEVLIKYDDIDKDKVDDNDNAFNHFDAPDWIDGMQDALLCGIGVILIPGDYYIDWTKTRNGYIDIWWLYDDGGLTVLVPHLLKSHNIFKNCTLRIMALENLGMQDQIELTQLMRKLRIDAEIYEVKSDSYPKIEIHSQNITKSKDKDKDNNNDIPDPEIDHGDDNTPMPSSPSDAVGAVGREKGYNKVQKDDKLADFPLVHDEEKYDDDDNDEDHQQQDTLFESKLTKSSFVEGRHKSLRHEVFTYDHLDQLNELTNSTPSSANNSMLDLETKIERKKKIKEARKKRLNDESTNIDDILYDIRHDDKLSKYAKRKITKWTKLGKLIEKSRDSDLCIVTMPFPRAEFSNYEYMKIIQVLTPRNMNNMLFVRGNQDQVLTFAL